MSRAAPRARVPPVRLSYRYALLAVRAFWHAAWDTSPGHAAPAPRGLARRARALRAARAAAAALPARRQDQDEQLSAESPASSEVSCKVTGIGPSIPIGATSPQGRSSANATPMVRHDGGGGGTMRDHELYATILGVQAPWRWSGSSSMCPADAVHVWLARDEGAAGGVPRVPHGADDLRPPRARVAAPRHLPAPDAAARARAPRRLPDARRAPESRALGDTGLEVHAAVRAAGDRLAAGSGRDRGRAPARSWGGTRCGASSAAPSPAGSTRRGDR